MNGWASRPIRHFRKLCFIQSPNPLALLQEFFLGWSSPALKKKLQHLWMMREFSSGQAQAKFRTIFDKQSSHIAKIAQTGRCWAQSCLDCDIAGPSFWLHKNRSSNEVSPPANPVRRSPQIPGQPPPIFLACERCLHAILVAPYPCASHPYLIDAF
jgi:hypothetical protein